MAPFVISTQITSSNLPAPLPKSHSIVDISSQPGSEAESAKSQHQIPPCASLEDLLCREKAHMAGAFRIFAKLGFADGASGHISLRGMIQTLLFFACNSKMTRPYKSLDILDQCLRPALWDNHGLRPGAR